VATPASREFDIVDAVAKADPPSAMTTVAVGPIAAPLGTFEYRLTSGAAVLFAVLFGALSAAWWERGWYDPSAVATGLGVGMFLYLTVVRPRLDAEPQFFTADGAALRLHFRYWGYRRVQAIPWNQLIWRIEDAAAGRRRLVTVRPRKATLDLDAHDFARLEPLLPASPPRS
jgi:hypothetical protein